MIVEIFIQMSNTRLYTVPFKPSLSLSVMGPFWTAGLLLFVPLTSCVLFEYRLRCPDTSAKWKENSDRYICGDGTVYHCMQDQEGRYVVFCAASIWVQPGTVTHVHHDVYVCMIIQCEKIVL